jgi:hypothetical protein
MFTWRFWRETLERAVKSAAQAPLMVWAVGDGVLDAFTMDYQLGLGVALGGAVFSLLTSIATVKLGATDSPSAID